MFHVGQKVVCVDAKLRKGFSGGHLHLIKEGTVYTVRSKTETILSPKLPKVSLEEVNSPYSYFEDRFRPVQERKTDISIFHEIRLNATNFKVKEDVK